MIIATFDPCISDRKKILFRGEGVFFWISQIFKGVKFVYPEKIEGGFDFLIILNISKFLEINPKGVKELITFFNKHKRSKDIFSLQGYPFFALSKQAWERFQIKIENGVYKKLSAEDKKKIIELKDNYNVLDVRDNLKTIEHFIINYQIYNLVKQDVFIEDYGSFYIEGKVSIGRGSKISSGVVIKGKSKIGKNVVLYPNSYIENTIVEDNCVILPSCVIRDSILEKNVQVGPYTHLRKNSIIKRGGKTGNFVEMKKSILGENSKSMHLSYLGDTTIGKNVNIGAGTITCNYDGEKKYPTKIEDNVFIGSGSELVAPVKIGKNSYVGAGSTITEDVPDNSLAIAREIQINKPDWVKKNKKKKK